MVQVAFSEISILGSMVALKPLPPMIWWRCFEGTAPGSTMGSRRWTLRVAHPKRRYA